MDDNKNTPDRSSNGLTLGLCIGLLFGVIFDNIAIGLGLGVALGSAVDLFQKKPKDNHPGAQDPLNSQDNLNP